MSSHSPKIVRLMLQTLGLSDELVGRPNAIRFGPFVFRSEAIVLSAAGGDNKINDITGTVDKKLTSLDSDRKYWLLFSGFKQFWSYKNFEDEAEQAHLFQFPYLKMERNDQNTFEQLAWASNPQTVGASTTDVATTVRAPRSSNPYSFKWWWVLDGESDPLSINTDFDVTPAFVGTVSSYTWMYGFAIRKSIMETFPEPECGPQALAMMAQSGPRPLASAAALVGAI